MNYVSEYLLHYTELAIATIDYNYDAFRSSADTTRKVSAQKQNLIYLSWRLPFKYSCDSRFPFPTNTYPEIRQQENLTWQSHNYHVTKHRLIATVSSSMKQASAQITVTYRCLLQLGVQITLSPFHNRTIRSHKCKTVLLEFWTVKQKSPANEKKLSQKKNVPIFTQMERNWP